MEDIDRSREGLDKLLAKYPDAKVVGIGHQHYAYLFAQRRPALGHFMVNDGPWTEVTLYHQDGRTSKAFREYAIWNRTGAVHDMEEGAVIDPPLIEGRTD